jgi:hypothetical protein
MVHWWKTIWWFLKSVKKNGCTIQQFHFETYVYPKELKARTQTDTCMPVYMRALLIMAKR